VTFHRFKPLVPNYWVSRPIFLVNNEEILMPSILVVAAPQPRQRLVNILREAGYLVVEADSEESALRIARSVSPKLILMAIIMPQGNGLEVAARLRRNSNGESPPIILLGSVTPIGIEEEPLASFVSGYLDLDVSSSDLLAAVRSQLNTEC
jgi:CheY-like chemotaxis protein